MADNLTIRKTYIKIERKTVRKLKGLVMEQKNKHYTYIVQCADGTLYTGYTNDIKKRINTHNSGKGAKYTKTRLPVKLVYFEIYDTKQRAMQREYEMKQLTRKQKLELIKGGNINLDSV